MTTTRFTSQNENNLTGASLEIIFVVRLLFLTRNQMLDWCNVNKRIKSYKQQGCNDNGDEIGDGIISINVCVGLDWN